MKRKLEQRAEEIRLRYEGSRFDQFLPETPDAAHLQVEEVDLEEWRTWRPE